MYRIMCFKKKNNKKTFKCCSLKCEETPLLKAKKG